MKAPDPVVVEKIAAEFARILREWLTDAEWAEMRRANAAETDDNVCHSHDYCDANMAMDEAFTNVRGEGADVGSYEDAALWGAAWDKAKAQHLSEAR